jgi:hypothetical protein
MVMQATELTEVLKRLDGLQVGMSTIQTDLKELKLESRVFQAQTTEKLESLSQKIDAVDVKLTQRIDAVDIKLTQHIGSLDKKVDGIEVRMNAQDARIWSLVVGVVLALFGLLAKLAFFPEVKV